MIDMINNSWLMNMILVKDITTHANKPQSNTSGDYKLVTDKDESFSTEAMKNGDITDIMDDLKTMKRPPNLLGSSIPESTLHRISKEVMKEAVEDKEMELK